MTSTINCHGKLIAEVKNCITCYLQGYIMISRSDKGLWGVIEETVGRGCQEGAVGCQEETV